MILRKFNFYCSILSVNRGIRMYRFVCRAFLFSLVVANATASTGGLSTIWEEIADAAPMPSRPCTNLHIPPESPKPHRGFNKDCAQKLKKIQPDKWFAKTRAAFKKISAISHIPEQLRQ